MTQPLGLWSRFASTAILLAATAAFLQARGAKESIPDRKQLAQFPLQAGSWSGSESRMDPKILQALGPGDFLTRFYRRSEQEPPIDFFVAYFPSQRTGDTIHSPQNCLPGAGWTPVETGRMLLERPGTPPVQVKRYVIAKGADRLLVLYWYQAHGRVVVSEYSAKFYLVWDAIRLNRTDGSLVRIITPIESGAAQAASERRATAFAREVLSILNEYVPN